MSSTGGTYIHLRGSAWNESNICGWTTTIRYHTAHDFCQKFQDFRSPLQQREKPVQQHQATNNTTQPETMESDCVCAICLDSFEVNQTVALSKNDCCRHAFHQACITEWLLKHEECPCCRSKLLVRGDMLETEEENNERLQEGLRTFDRLQGDELAPPNFAVSVEEASSSP